MNRNIPSIFAFVVVSLIGQGCGAERIPTGLVGDAVFEASATAADESGRYIVLFAAEHVSADFAERAAKLGGSVEASLDEIGVATVIGLTDSGAAELATATDIRHVERDPITAQNDDLDSGDSPAESPEEQALAPADATDSPTLAWFYPRQWSMRAVFAHEAWAAGHLGSREVRVAIVDTGIDYLHPDLVGLVDLEASKSFVPEENAAIEARFPGRLPISDLRWHGTAAASIVASNAKVVAGVNRYVTLIAVKTADSAFKTSVGRMISGIVYAVDQGADVISLSDGRQRDKSKDPGIVSAFERAVNYAFRKGALLVSVPFNDAADLDHNGDFVRLPCEAANAICASATGPTGADGFEGPWYEVDTRAPYSSYGRSAVDVAAPGGVDARFRRVWLPCTATWTQSSNILCRTNSVPLERRVAQGVGTSWAAPHVAGLAALLVAQLGHGNPALIRSRILQSADDLGEPGTDPYYGKGRINIARALGLIY